MAKKDRKILQLKLDSLRTLQNLTTRQVVRCRSAAVTPKFIEDGGDDTELNSKEKAIDETKPKIPKYRPSHGIVITYNLYQVDANTMQANHGMLVLNRLPAPLVS